MLDRRSITYTNTEGYRLTISGISPAWGHLTVEQYRVDDDHDLSLVSTTVVPRARSGLNTVTLAGSWAHAPADPPADPAGVAQGVDVIVVRGDRH